MDQVRRRYTTVDGKVDWLVTLSYDEGALNRAHWFEAKIGAKSEATGDSFAFPGEIATYRIGETERPFREYVRLDFGGDRDAALRHIFDTIFRRVYSYLERGH